MLNLLSRYSRLKGVSMRRLLVLILMIPSMVLAGDNDGSNGENRCDELGSICKCSEPLQYAGTYPPGANFFDPPDSVTKECDGGSPVSYGHFGGPAPTSVAADAFLPPGHTVQRILQSTGGGLDILANEAITFGPAPGQTYCVRVYWRADVTSTEPDTQFVAGDNSQVKVQTIGWFDVGWLTIQMGYESGGPVGSGSFGYFRQDHGPSDYPVASSEHVHSMNECRTNWCRFETCIDMTAGGLANARQRIAVLTPNASPHYDCEINGVGTTGSACETFTIGTLDGNVSPAITQSKISIGQVYTQNLPAPTLFYLTYAMDALSSYNPSFWIGAAEEVEGGGGGPTWSIGTPTLTPNSCSAHDTPCTNPTLQATASGSATGNISWDYDCDASDGFTATPIASCNAGGATTNCSFTTACNFSGLSSGATKTVTIQSTRQSLIRQSTAVFTVNNPTYTVGTFTLNTPSICTQGSCGDFADVSATSSGTAQGVISWTVDCDTGAAPAAVPIDSLGTGAACANSTSCTRANVCDYSTKNPNTYTAEVCSTRESIAHCRQTTFQVLPASTGPAPRRGGSRGGPTRLGGRDAMDHWWKGIKEGAA